MKRSPSHICLALLLIYGMVPVLIGSSVSREWAAESNAVAVFGVLFLLDVFPFNSSFAFVPQNRTRSLGRTAQN